MLSCNLEDAELVSLEGYLSRYSPAPIEDPYFGKNHLIVPRKFVGSDFLKGVVSRKDIDSKELGEREKFGKLSNVDLGEASIFHIDIQTLFNSRISTLYGDSFVRYLQGSSTVNYLYDRSKISYMYDHSQVKALMDSSRVNNMEGSSFVSSLQDNAKVGFMDHLASIDHLRSGGVVVYMQGSSVVREKERGSEIKYMSRFSRVGLNLCPLKKIKTKFHLMLGDVQREVSRHRLIISG